MAERMKVKTGYVVRSFKLKTFNGCPYMDLDVGDLIVLSDATDDISGSPAKAQMRCAAKPHPVRSVCTPRTSVGVALLHLFRAEARGVDP